ncbi:MAG TPA: hypothetical protein VFL29_10785 [Candidatus Dormibacteraeota bacterium]|nr:hypothetical protein [Candidatus Dormibacteraeota bacterium]
MSTDIKEITDTVEQVAFGAAETAAEVASDPIGSVRRQVKGLERKGTPAARKINRRVNARLNAAAEPALGAFKVIRKTANTVQKSAVNVAGELAPEKVVLRGLRQIKSQAKRPDMVGDAAKRTLKFFNRQFKSVARVATRFENASELTPASKPATTTRRPATRRSRRRAA